MEIEWNKAGKIDLVCGIGKESALFEDKHENSASSSSHNKAIMNILLQLGKKAKKSSWELLHIRSSANFLEQKKTKSRFDW